MHNFFFDITRKIDLGRKCRWSSLKSPFFVQNYMVKLYILVLNVRIVQLVKLIQSLSDLALIVVCFI